MAATLDGRVEASGAVFESKFVLPWSFTEEAAAQKYAAQLPHNMLSSPQGRPSFQSSPAAAGGLKSRPMPIRLPASRCHRREEILALCRNWRAPCPVRGRSANAAHRGGADCGYDILKRLGRICRDFCSDPRCPSGARTGQERIERPRTGRRPTGDWSRQSSQTLKIRGCQFGSPHCGGEKCSGQVTPSALSLQLSLKPRSSWSIRKSPSLPPFARKGGTG